MKQYWWIIIAAVLIVVGLLKMVIMKNTMIKRIPKSVHIMMEISQPYMGHSTQSCCGCCGPCMRQDAVYAGKVQSCRLISVPEKPCYTTSFRPCRNSLS